MARPRGSRNVRGWMITPNEMAEVGLLTAVDLEMTSQGIVRLNALDAKKSIDAAIKSLTQKEEQQLLALKKDRKVNESTRSKDTKEALTRIEGQIAKNTKESAYIINNYTRQPQKIGKDYSKSVEFSGREIESMKGSILTHNHPSQYKVNPKSNIDRKIFGASERDLAKTEKAIGISFSPADIGMVTYARLAEIRAVVPIGITYSMKAKSSAAFTSDRVKDRRLVRSAITRAENKVNDRLVELTQSGRMDLASALIVKQHLIAREFASRSKGKYEYRVSGGASDALNLLSKLEKIYDGD
jgi:hypothetical protein